VFLWLSRVLFSPVAFAFVLLRFSFTLEIAGVFLVMSECRIHISRVHVCVIVWLFVVFFRELVLVCMFLLGVVSSCVCVFMFGSVFVYCICVCVFLFVVIVLFVLVLVSPRVCAR